MKKPAKMPFWSARRIVTAFALLLALIALIAALMQDESPSNLKDASKLKDAFLSADSSAGGGRNPGSGGLQKNEATNPAKLKDASKLKDAFESLNPQNLKDASVQQNPANLKDAFAHQNPANLKDASKRIISEQLLKLPKKLELASEAEPKFVQTEPSAFDTGAINQAHLQPASSKPNNKASMLAIVIDDVAFKHQASALLALKNSGVMLTPSFMPPNLAHPFTNEFAKDFGDDFMLHLPLEALNFAHPEPDTLLASSPCELIRARINEHFKSFKNLKFINNHTGSKFTADLRAMRCLFNALLAHGGRFIDSRTNAASVGERLAAEFKQPYLHRDVFLDNDQSQVAKQLDAACKLAGKRGYALAIGHPHEATLKALKDFRCSKARLVGINEYYKAQKNQPRAR